MHISSMWRCYNYYANTKLCAEWHTWFMHFNNFTTRFVLLFVQGYQNQEFCLKYQFENAKLNEVSGYLVRHDTNICTSPICLLQLVQFQVGSDMNAHFTVCKAWNKKRQGPKGANLPHLKDKMPLLASVTSLCINLQTRSNWNVENSTNCPWFLNPYFMPWLDGVKVYINLIHRGRYGTKLMNRHRQSLDPPVAAVFHCQVMPHLVWKCCKYWTAQSLL